MRAGRRENPHVRDSEPTRAVPDRGNRKMGYMDVSLRNVDLFSLPVLCPHRRAVRPPAFTLEDRKIFPEKRPLGIEMWWLTNQVWAICSLWGSIVRLPPAPS